MDCYGRNPRESRLIVMEGIHENPDGLSLKESMRIQMDCHGRNQRESRLIVMEGIHENPD